MLKSQAPSLIHFPYLKMYENNVGIAHGQPLPVVHPKNLYFGVFL